MAASSLALAGSVGSESSIGVQTQYSSNPDMLSSGARAAESAALLVDVPATYNGDEQTVDLTTRARFAQTHGDVPLLSNYLYLDADWRLADERNLYTAAASWHRDSTFYNVYESAALFGVNVPRTEDTATLGWKRQISERSDLQLTGSWDHVSYDASSADELTNYDYGQVSLQYDLALTERWQASVAAGYGNYERLDHSFRNDNRFSNLSLDRSLNERWSLELVLGYSYQHSHSLQASLYCPAQSVLLCELFPQLLQIITVPVRSSGGSGDGSVNLTRRYERATLGLAASRAIQPSGLGALLTQDDASLAGRLNWTERWDLAATLHASRIIDPLHQLQLGRRHYEDLDLSAIWQWTEHWTLNIGTNLNLQHIQYASTQQGGVLRAAGATLSVSVARQFGRIRLK